MASPKKSHLKLGGYRSLNGDDIIVEGHVNKRLTYRDLQQIARINDMPCNLKKQKLVDVINAKIVGNEEGINIILKKVKDERETRQKERQNKLIQMRMKKISESEENKSEHVNRQSTVMDNIDKPYLLKGLLQNMISKNASKNVTICKTEMKAEYTSTTLLNSGRCKEASLCLRSPNVPSQFEASLSSTHSPQSYSVRPMNPGSQVVFNCKTRQYGDMPAELSSRTNSMPRMPQLDGPYNEFGRVKLGGAATSEMVMANSGTALQANMVVPKMSNRILPSINSIPSYNKRRLEGTTGKIVYDTTTLNEMSRIVMDPCEDKSYMHPNMFDNRMTDSIFADMRVDDMIPSMDVFPPDVDMSCVRPGEPMYNITSNVPLNYLAEMAAVVEADSKNFYRVVSNKPSANKSELLVGSARAIRENIPTWNNFLEQRTSGNIQSLLKCKFGCQVLLPTKDAHLEHETHCLKQPQHCPMVNCHWVNQLDCFTNHILTHHIHEVVMDSETTFVVKFGTDQSYNTMINSNCEKGPLRQTFFQYVDSGLFIIFVIGNYQSMQTYVYIQYVSDYNNFNSCGIIEILRPDGVPYQWTGKIYSLSTSPTRIITNRRCLIFNMNSMPVTQNFYVHVKLRNLKDFSP